MCLEVKLMDERRERKTKRGRDQINVFMRALSHDASETLAPHWPVRSRCDTGSGVGSLDPQEKFVRNIPFIVLFFPH